LVDPEEVTTKPTILQVRSRVGENRLVLAKCSETHQTHYRMGEKQIGFGTMMLDTHARATRGLKMRGYNPPQTIKTHRKIAFPC
jgi:hypothetical protein